MPSRDVVSLSLIIGGLALYCVAFAFTPPSVGLMVFAGVLSWAAVIYRYTTTREP